jgi:hypothetical protein
MLGRVHPCNVGMSSGKTSLFVVALAPCALGIDQVTIRLLQKTGTPTDVGFPQTIPQSGGNPSPLRRKALAPAGILSPCLRQTVMRGDFAALRDSGTGISKNTLGVLLTRGISPRLFAGAPDSSSHGYAHPQGNPKR